MIEVYMQHEQEMINHQSFGSSGERLSADRIYQAEGQEGREERDSNRKRASISDVYGVQRNHRSFSIAGLAVQEVKEEIK